jgi:hypothetical protein
MFQLQKAIVPVALVQVQPVSWQGVSVNIDFQHGCAMLIPAAT